MSLKYLLIVIVNVFLINPSFGARILIYIPTPSFSHQVIFQPIVRELSLRGHQVVLITPNPMNDPKLVNLTEINVGFSYDGIVTQFNYTDKSQYGIGQTTFLKSAIQLIVWGVYDKQLSSPDLQKLIQDPNEHFDLVIIELVLGSALAALSERFNCPLVGMTSMDLMTEGHLIFGNSVNPSYYSDLFLTFSKPTTFLERVYSSLYNLWMMHFIYTDVYPNQNKLVKKHFGESAPTVEELHRRISIVLANTHPAIYGAKPVGPMIVEIGGIYKRPRKNLTKDLQQFLDSATEGAIYFSLGSNVKSSHFSKEKIDIFIETFKDLPYKVLWKFDAEDLPGKPDKVKISKWFPQSDVLHHPNVKLFITQGGAQSWEEAIHGQVPLIGFPFLGDQYWNVDRMEKLEIGIKMDVDDVDKRSLTAAIQEIINNSKYSKNIQKLSSLLNDQPMKPLDKAIYWIEYVLRHGHVTAFHSPTMTIPWYQYFLLDVIGFFVVCFAIVIYVTYSIIKVTLRILGFSNKPPKQKIS